ncbi:phage tail protein [Pseudooceanicola sp.]|uniref:phage tail protein n=1 Tax=Pseudooceanicola sp. TaxID=1914328 RepID=UPI003511934F
MKRRLAVALLATTALTAPTEAKAGPVVPFLSGFISALSPVYLGGAGLAGFGAGVAAGSATAGFLGTLGGKLLLGVGLSYLSQALMPKPRIPEPSERMANFAQPVSYAEWVLGRTRKGGPLGFTGFQNSTDVVTGTTGRKRHYSPIVAAHPCHQIVTHFLDEREVEIDANGLVTTAPMAGYYRIRPFLGQPGQTADAELVNAFAEVTAAFDFAALTGAHIWAKRPPQEKFSDIYPTGRQGAWTPVLDGHNGIYDPRTGSTGFTRNAALLMAFWITTILGQEVDWAEVAIEADVCDEVVTNGDGGTQPRWRIDGTISDDQEFEDQRAQMAAACDAWMYEREDGKVGFRVGRYVEPTITLTEADFLSVEISEGSSGRNAPTEVAARYVEPGNNWRESPSGAFVIDAGSRQVREEPSLYLVASHNQASRLNKRIARTKRAPYQVRGTLGLIGYKLRGHRFVRVQVLGLDLVCEVGEFWRNGGGLSFDLSANSVSASDFDFVAATEEPTRPVFEKVVSDDSVEAPTGLTGEAQDGGSILWIWDQQEASLTQQLRFRKSGTSDWQILSVPASQSTLTTSGLVDGESYEGQLRNRTSALRPSDWHPVAPITVAVVANSTPPAVHGAFSAALDGSDVDLTFTAPNDPNYYATRIYRTTGSTNFGDATLVRTEYGIPSNADSWTDTAPGSGTHRYWVEPINQSGVAGPKTGPQTVTIP